MRVQNAYCFSVLGICILFQLTSTTPVSRASRMVREVYPEVEQSPVPIPIESGSQAKVCIVGDVVYGVGETVPSEQACLKCICNAPEVNCETLTCNQQPGCKAIHKPNKCCPDYQCECHHDGKAYANGERLLSAPGNECHVCYCRGGEVQCAEVGCYTRDDCEPSHVPGQCCPKYDHCPPREPISDRIQYTTEPTAVSKLEQDFPTTWSLTGAPEIYNATYIVPSTQTEKQLFDNEGSGDDSVSIEFSSTTNTISFVTNEAKLDVSTPVSFSLKEIAAKKRNEPKVNIYKLDKSTQTGDERPKITIQEVIPQRTEYQITSAPKDSTTIKSAIKIIEDSSNELIDSQSYASEKTEVYDHPPPVLRIGDQLLFFKQGQLVPEKDASTPSPVITLIGAEGLQIGVGSEEIIEHELLPSNTEEPIDVLMNNGKKIDDSLQDISVNSSEDISKELDKVESSTGSANSEEKISSEEYINIKEITIENTSDISSPLSTETYSTENPITQNTIKILKPIKRDQSSFYDTSTQSHDIELSSTQLLDELVTRISDSKHTDSGEFILEENPYYPALPEDIITHGEETDLEETSHKVESSTASLESTEESNSSCLEIYTTDIHTNESKKIQGKTQKELKEDSKIDAMMGDAPNSDSSESGSKEDVLVKKLDSKEKVVEKKLVLADPEVSSSEENFSESEEGKHEIQNDEEVVNIAKKDLPTPDEVKILQEVLDVISNKTIPDKTNKEWLKNETSEETINPLMNERAIIPSEILELPAPSDFIHETTDINDAGLKIDKQFIMGEANITEKLTSKEEVIETTEPKSKKEELDPLQNDQEVADIKLLDIKKPEIVGLDLDVTKITTELEKSKETLETSEENSKETTTSKNQHTNLMANDDASVEVNKDSSSMDTSELVETLPGFKETTNKMTKGSEEVGSEEDLESHPKSEVEIVETTPKPKEETQSSEEKEDMVEESLKLQADVRIDEKHKRDVVKKVLKDTFNNPKENIRTELVDDAPLKVLEEIEKEHEQQKVPHDHTTINYEGETEPFDSEIKIEDEFGDNPTKKGITKMEQGDQPMVIEQSPKATEVIQRVGDVSKFRESAENLDTSLIGIFRDFFSKSQLRYANNAEEKV